MLTREQFQSQFTVKVSENSDVFGKPLCEAMKIESITLNTVVYRCLNMLLIRKDNGCLYCH